MKPDFVSETKPLLKPTGRWAIAAAVIAAIGIAVVGLQHILQFERQSTVASTATNDPPSVSAVSSLGRIRPEGEVVHLSAPVATNGVGVSRIAKLLVEEGDRVKAGEVVAVLDNYENLAAALQVAQEEVKVAEANLAQVKVGAKTGELEAQRATVERLEADLQGQLAAQDKVIARLEAQLANAQREFQRYRQLFQNGAVAASELDSRSLTLTSNQEQLNEAIANRSRVEATFQEQIKTAQATLDQIAEVRPTDVQAATAEVNRAIANATKAKSELDLAYIRSPLAGQILKIHTRPGEVVGDQGIVAIGHTDQMNVIAEVYELDVSKVQLGQTATITSSAFSGKLEGTVTHVGLMVDPQNVLSTDPTADVNRRIVEVKIRLSEADSQKVANLTNLQVNVVIEV